VAEARLRFGRLTAALCLAPLLFAAPEGKPIVGAEYFLNRDDTQELVQKHFRVMREHGLTVARVFVIWNDIEPRPGTWTFERYDWIYDAAAANGIHIATTLCAEDPPGWLKGTSFYHQRADMNDPAYRERAAVYIAKVVGRYRTHAAQGPWLLMNEPTLREDFDEPTMRAFGKWLQARYGTVDAVNRRWYQPIAGFDSVKVVPEQWRSGWTDYYSFVDWREFRIDNLCDTLRWIGARVRELDTTHPTHGNPHGLTGNLTISGQDPWKESEVLDFLGASIHPAWHFSDFTRADFGVAYAYSVDLLASAAAGKPWWVTELQGGPTLFTGGRPMNPTPGEIKRWMWDAYGAGAKGVVFWMWNVRTEGNEGGEWGLASADAHPSERAVAAKEVIEAVNAMPSLAQSHPQRAHAAILYNREALILSQLDGRTQTAARRGFEPVLSLIGCHRALHEAHVAADFVSLEQVKSGGLKGYAVLYLPYSYAIDDEALAAVRKFVADGGTLWADGLVGWKKEAGEMRAVLPGGLADVFGWEARDVEPDADATWRVRMELKGANVFLRDGENRIQATSHPFGKGRAIYYNSALTLHYMRKPNAIEREWIAAPAAAATDGDVLMEKGPAEVGMRVLEHPGGRTVVLVNWGATTEVTLRTPTAVNVNVPAGEVRVLEVAARGTK
jgi:beta-galactosidase